MSTLMMQELLELTRERDELRAEIERLRAALLEEWKSNHAEHCGRQECEGNDPLCGWPLRAELISADEQSAKPSIMDVESDVAD